ncbi:Protein DegV [subsurface metagenome]
MPKVIVMTDAVAGIPKELAGKYQIRVVPTAHIIYDGHIYLEGSTINAMEAYQLLRQDPDKFNTAAVPPAYLLDVYRELGARSQEILFITISSALSALSQSATTAADLLQQEVPETTLRVMNSRTAGSGQGLVVLAAAKAAAQGMNLEQVASIAEQAREKTGTLILLDTIRYIYRAGRAPKLASVVGSMLGVKPLSRMSDTGEFNPAGVSRTRKGGIKKMLEMVRADAGTDALHFMVMHADAPRVAEELSEQIKQEFKCLSMIISEFSPIMGYATGPGTLTVGFQPELDFLQQ